MTTLEKTTINRLECYLGTHEAHIIRTADEQRARHVVVKWGTTLFTGAKFRAVDLNGSESWLSYADIAGMFELGGVAKRHMKAAVAAPSPVKRAPAAPRKKPAAAPPAPLQNPWNGRPYGEPPAPAPAPPAPVPAAPKVSHAVLPAANTSKSKVRWDRRFFSKVA